MDKRNILFVDDEPNILSGLKRMLRPMRDEFDMQFAESGNEALLIMEQVEFDVVVSDMRMPGMSGAELLEEVLERYPYSIRIMLTGQADEESILSTVGIVHQFLAKPCDPDLLKDVLFRSSALHELISQPANRAVVSGLATLPSIPEVYDKLRRAVLNPEVSIAEISKIIEKDMAMTAKVLQLVNSAFFGLYHKVNNPMRAVNLLGLDTIKGLVLGVGAFSTVQVSSGVISVPKLWSHSMAVGECAKKIAMSVSNDGKFIDNCFIGGLLHDIGKLILLAKMSDKYEQAIALAREKNIRLRLAEKEIFNTVQNNLGAYLMGLWGLEGRVVEAIGFHQCLKNYPEHEFSPAVAVHLANVLYYENRPEELIGAPCELDMEYLRELEMDGKIEQWREICTEIIDQDEDDD